MFVCHRWKLSTIAKRLLCSQTDETWNHVLQCKNIHIDRVRKEHINKISKELFLLNTYLMMHKHIMKIIENWTSTTDIQAPSIRFNFPSLALRRAHEDQAEIGFHSFSRGLLSKTWGKIHDDDYRRKRLPAKYKRIRWEKS